MEKQEKGWVIVNIGHPRTGSRFIVSDSFFSTRSKAVADFIDGTRGDWKYWYKEFNYRVIKATKTIKVNL